MIYTIFLTLLALRVAYFNCSLHYRHYYLDQVRSFKTMFCKLYGSLIANSLYFVPKFTKNLFNFFHVFLYT